jgi:hypothetical protein
VKVPFRLYPGNGGVSGEVMLWRFMASNTLLPFQLLLHSL